MSKDVPDVGYIAKNAIAFDQQLNAILGGEPDETLSARSYRAFKNDRQPGKFLMPFIDVLFIWQKTDPEVDALAGEVVKGHCRMAYYKEILRRSLPPEYREKP